MTELFDNTRLTDGDNCLRFFYWRHIRHFTGDGVSYPLLFGLSWHAAQDIIWPGCQKIKDDDTLASLALGAFVDQWQQAGGKLQDQMTDDEIFKSGFRNENTAFEMIYAYIKQRRTFIEGIEIIKVELPFAVPLDPNNPNLLYVGRIDKVIRWNGSIWGIEHKTSSMYKKDGGFRATFIDSFSPNSQIDGYTHALRMLYGKELKGIMVDAALVHKTVQAFSFIPIERTFNMLDSWRWEALERVKKLREQKANLKKAQASDNFMAAFPKNTSSCIQFNASCPYLGLCKFIENPIGLNHVPPGYAENKWEPFDILKLASIGVTPED